VRPASRRRKAFGLGPLGPGHDDRSFNGCADGAERRGAVFQCRSRCYNVVDERYVTTLERRAAPRKPPACRKARVPLSASLPIAGDLYELRLHVDRTVLRNAARDEFASIEPAFAPARRGRRDRNEYVALAYVLREPFGKRARHVPPPALEREYGTLNGSFIWRKRDDAQRAQVRRFRRPTRQTPLANARPGRIARTALWREEKIENRLQLHAAAFTTNYAGVASGLACPVPVEGLATMASSSVTPASTV
jgi:hypothetical protein